MRGSEAIQGYKQVYPKRYRNLARIELALRRSRIDTMELIGEMLHFYEDKSPPERAEDIHLCESGRNILSPTR